MPYSFQPLSLSEKQCNSVVGRLTKQTIIFLLSIPLPITRCFFSFALNFNILNLVSCSFAILMKYLYTLIYSLNCFLVQFLEPTSKISTPRLLRFVINISKIMPVLKEEDFYLRGNMNHVEFCFKMFNRIFHLFRKFCK